MSDIVRNVTLRVNVEAGEMRLGQMDLSPARRMMDELRRDLQGTTGSVVNRGAESISREDRDIERVNDQLKELASNIGRVNSSWSASGSVSFGGSRPNFVGGASPFGGAQGGGGADWWNDPIGGPPRLPQRPPPLPKSESRPDGSSGFNEAMAALAATFGKASLAIGAARLAMDQLIASANIFHSVVNIPIGRAMTTGRSDFNTAMAGADLLTGTMPPANWRESVFGPNAAARRASEADIRAYESDMSGHTPGQQQSYRERMERTQSFREAVAVETHGIRHSVKKVDILQEALRRSEGAEATAKANRNRIINRAQDAREALEKEIDQNSLNLPGGVKLTMKSHADAHDNIRLAESQGVAEAERQAAEAAAKSLEIKKQINAETQKQQQSQQKLHEMAVAEANAAHQDVHRERQGLRQSRIGFGSADLGTQARLIELQKKHQTIMDRRKANIAAGRDEFEGVERYTQEEGNLANAYGSIAGKSFDDQAERDAKQAGFQGKEVNEQTLREKEELARKAADEAEKTRKGAAAAEANAQTQVEKQAQDIVNKMEDVFEKKGRYEELLKALDDLKAKSAVDRMVRWAPLNLFGAGGP